MYMYMWVSKQTGEQAWNLNMADQDFNIAREVWHRSEQTAPFWMAGSSFHVKLAIS